MMTITGFGGRWYILDNSWPANPRRVCSMYPSLREAQRSLLNPTDAQSFDEGVAFSALSGIQTV